MALSVQNDQSREESELVSSMKKGGLAMVSDVKDMLSEQENKINKKIEQAMTQIESLLMPHDGE